MLILWTQAGYRSDGYACLECPEGMTCDGSGAVACVGQCAAGIQSECDAALGYARCERECNVSSVLGGVASWRGSYVQSPSCAPYFRCANGWVKRFHRRGTVECVPCASPPFLAKHVTPGLSANDEGSCLWECNYGLQYSVAWNGAACEYMGLQTAVPKHPAGWYGITGVALATCGAEFTSEANTTAARGGCLACPPLPARATRVANARQCEWECAYGWTARGSRCVRELGAEWLCTDAGMTRDREGKCVNSSVPWNRAGTGRVGGAEVVSEAWLAAVPNTTSAAQSTAWGASGRHTVMVAGRGVQTEGPLCSTTVAWIGGVQYLLGAVCNQSFVAFANLSRGGVRLEVLIGQAGSPGWADGFRTQARFQTELYVATSGGNNHTVWVLDRWNCLVREVTIWPRPGDYRTRVDTVHGLTERFLVVDQPKCYGAGSLAGPRRFWEVGGGVLLFTDDHGLWQLTLETGALASVMSETGGGFEADDVIGVELSADRHTLRLGFRDGRVWTVRAGAEACPEDRTSRDGGDCAVQCEWLAGSGSYVNRTSGACVKCVAAAGCGLGTEPAVCTRDSQGWCRPCPALRAGMRYMEAGVCGRAVYLAPCPVGFWGQGVCEPCPLFTTTALAGATRVEQCKCVAGLVRRGGLCVADNPLYAFGAGAVCADACYLPGNASLVAVRGMGGQPCVWRCNAGFYKQTLSLQCKPCEAAGSGRSLVTSGDDDSPLSCESA